MSIFQYLLILLSFIVTQNAIASENLNTLFFMEKQKDKCAWFISKAPTYEKKQFLNRTLSCQPQVLISKSSAEIIYLEGNSIIKIDYKEKDVSKIKTKLTPLPKEINPKNEIFSIGITPNDELLVRHHIVVSSKDIYKEKNKNYIQYKNIKVDLPFIDKGYRIGANLDLAELYTFKNKVWTLTKAIGVQSPKDIQPNDIYSENNPFKAFSDDFENKKSKFFHLKYERLDHDYCKGCKYIKQDNEKVKSISKMIGLPKNTKEKEYGIKFIPIQKHKDNFITITELTSDLENEINTVISSDPLSYCIDNFSECKKLDFKGEGFAVMVNDQDSVLIGENGSFNNATILIPNKSSVEIKNFPNSQNATWVNSEIKLF